MSTTHNLRRRRSVIALIAIFLLTVLPAFPVSANSAGQTPPFGQDWYEHQPYHAPSTTGPACPASSATSGTSRPRPAPTRRLCCRLDGRDDVDVIANPPDANIADMAASRIRLAEPGRRPAGLTAPPTRPIVLINLQTSGCQERHGRYILRDLDGSTDDAVQPVALQYRSEPAAR